MGQSVRAGARERQSASDLRIRRFDPIDALGHHNVDRGRGHTEFLLCLHWISLNILDVFVDRVHSMLAVAEQRGLKIWQLGCELTLFTLRLVLFAHVRLALAPLFRRELRKVVVFGPFLSLVVGMESEQEVRSKRKQEVGGSK